MTNAERLAALAAIERKHGGVLRPDDVVEAARSKSHPLHDEFEWDDTKAAAAHRIEQARTLIRCVYVRVTTETVRLRAPVYVHDPDKTNEQGYVRAIDLKDDAARARAAIAAEWEHVAACAARVQAIALEMGMDIEAQRADGILRVLGPVASEASDKAAE